jgi:hypothetical protein
MVDHRDVAASIHFPYRVDKDRKEIYLWTIGNEGDEEEITLSLEWALCPTCEGNGSHVNPSIDSNGITASEMRELGDDFREEYFSGVYDIPCNQCKGEKVIPFSSDPRFEKAIQEAWDNAYNDARTRYYESGGHF